MVIAISAMSTLPALVFLPLVVLPLRVQFDVDLAYTTLYVLVLRVYLLGLPLTDRVQGPRLEHALVVRVLVTLLSQLTLVQRTKGVQRLGAQVMYLSVDSLD